MNVTFSPIGPWPLVAVAALLVTVLTVWAYRQRMRSSSGRWRWFALGLRLAAILLCVLASLRPSVVLQEKKKQSATIAFLLDDSSSMSFRDEVRGQSRWGAALKAVHQAREVASRFGPGLDVKYFRFDSKLREHKVDDAAPPDGRETALGPALLEAPKLLAGTRVAALVVLSDGASNSGTPPLEAAQRLRGQQVPVVAVGFGSEIAGANSRDLSIRDVVTPPTVFVKNQLDIRGTVVARGFANQPIDVELWVEDEQHHEEKIATQRLQAREGSDLIAIKDLKYVPQTSGEKMIKVKVAPKEGELVTTNNEYATFVTVLKGGLSVLYLQGPGFSWEFRYLYRALAASPNIQAELEVVRSPAAGGKGEVPDEKFAPGRYDVYILGDLPADSLTPVQHRLLAAAVDKGAGLIMLGGRSSFGPGGWGSTELARLLPVNLHPGDGQLEPEGGVKFVPTPTGLDSPFLQVAPTKDESARIWKELPNMTGTNRFFDLKPSATIYGQAAGPQQEPVMIGIETLKARVLAFGGETWVWPRATDVGRLAHQKFWRQVIFWLAHKEDQGENQVKIELDPRRVAAGQKLDVTITARDSKDAPIPGVNFEDTRVEREGSNGQSVKVGVFNQGNGARGPFYDTNQPGNYRVTTVATKDGQVIGRDSARFIVYQDDRELENPAADLALLRQVAEVTDGKFLPPEKLPAYLKSLDGTTFTEYVSQTEHRVWDNWPFFLIFTALMTLEWWLRKRHGWV